MPLLNSPNLPYKNESYLRLCWEAICSLLNVATKWNHINFVHILCKHYSAAYSLTSLPNTFVGPFTIAEYLQRCGNAGWITQDTRNSMIFSCRLQWKLKSSLYPFSCRNGFTVFPLYRQSEFIRVFLFASCHMTLRQQFNYVQ